MLLGNPVLTVQLAMLEEGALWRTWLLGRESRGRRVSTIAMVVNMACALLRLCGGASTGSGYGCVCTHLMGTGSW